MSFSIVEGWSEQEKRALVRAMCESKDPDCIMNHKIEHMFPTRMSAEEHERTFGKEHK